MFEALLAQQIIAIANYRQLSHILSYFYTPRYSYTYTHTPVKNFHGPGFSINHLVSTSFNHTSLYFLSQEMKALRVTAMSILCEIC